MAGRNEGEHATGTGMDRLPVFTGGIPGGQSPPFISRDALAGPHAMLGNGQNLPLFQGCFSTAIAGAFLKQAPEVLAGRAARWGGGVILSRHVLGSVSGPQGLSPHGHRQHTLAVPGCLPCPAHPHGAEPCRRPGLGCHCHPLPPSSLDLHEFSVLKTITLASQLRWNPAGSGYLKTLQALK